METTTNPANPYEAKLVPMTEEAIAKLLKAKASDLNFFTRTVRNAIRGTRRHGEIRYVGRTATGAYINADATALPIVDFAVMPDGRVFRYVGGGSAYSTVR